MAGGKRGGQGGRGAKPGSHRKGAQIGSGGKNRRSLEGHGPTPPARMRPGHPAARAAARARRAGEAASGPRGGGGARGGRRPGAETSEIVAGRNAVVEALRAELPVSTLYVAARLESDDRVREALKLAADRHLPLLETPRAELDRLTGGAVHQGLALQMPPYDYAHPDDLLAAAETARQAPLVVALDGVTDPHNLGAVVRSVGAFGGHGVLVPERRSAGMTATAWKASAGVAARVRVARTPNLTRALVAWKKAGLLVVGLDSGGELALDALEAAGDPLCLVVGSEGKGLSRLVRETCDLVVSIPMAGGTESLNASVAAGVALYEVARRRRAD